MNNFKPFTPLRKNQSGLAAITVTMIIMIIITLIVLAGAQLANREQRQTLDRQLNTQAFYAAESGVNDAVQVMQRATDSYDPLNPADPQAYTADCGKFISDYSLDNQLSSSDNVSYPCLLIDPEPTTWEGSISSASRTVPLKPVGSSVNSVTIAWQNKDGDSDFSNCPTDTDSLPNYSNWNCKTPILRFDLVPTDNPGRGALNNSLMTRFLFPSVTGGAISQMNYSAGGGKQLVKCDPSTMPKYCKITIDMSSPPGAPNSAYLRISSIYGEGEATVCVNTTDCGAGTPKLSGAQVVIDSTGRAADVLRRIQVRIPLVSTSLTPDYAIQSGHTICKLLQVDDPIANGMACN